MVDSEKLMDLAIQFDNETTRVLGELPRSIKLAEVIGIQSYPDKTTKISISRGGILYLCWVKTSVASPVILRLKEEIKAREDWEDRWEPWEIYGSTEPHALIERLVKSRLKTKTDKHEEAYGMATSNRVWKPVEAMKDSLDELYRRSEVNGDRPVFGARELDQAKLRQDAFSNLGDKA